MRLIIPHITLIALCFSGLNSGAQIGWGTFGVGLQDGVTAIATDTNTNTLYAGGLFTMSGATATNAVAKWDGNSWQPLGGGITAPDGFTMIYSMIIFNGELYVAGQFDTVDNTATSHVVRWDGTNWHQVGQSNFDQFTSIRVLHVHNDEMYAGGTFDDLLPGFDDVAVAKLVGNNWEEVGGVFNGLVFALTTYNNQLLAGGSFYGEAGETGALACEGVAVWDGSEWTQLGEGITPNFGIGVQDFEIFQGQLYATGDFSESGGNSVRAIAKWDGTNWVGLGDGILYAAEELQAYGDWLYVGGSVHYANNQPIAGDLAKWNGTAWADGDGGVHGDPTDNTVHALGLYNGSLVVGGRFDTVGTFNTLAHSIARLTASPNPIESQSTNPYPIPSDDHFFIDLPSGWNTENVLVELFDAKGQLVSSFMHNAATLRIQSHELVDGLYYYRVDAGDQELQGSFLVKH